MKARADDMIYWVPSAYRQGNTGDALVHSCPTAVAITQQRRDTLDPMALGECRYCHEPMPVREAAPA